MDKPIEIMLLLHVINYSEELKKTLHTNLREKLNLEFGLKVVFRRTKQYWKIPEHTQCFFKLIFEDDCEKLMEKLPGFLGVGEFLLLGDNNEFIWDKKTHGGVFLNENVEWVHAYFWNE